MTKDGNLEVIPELVQREGRNPNQRIISIDKYDNIEEQTMNAIYYGKGNNFKEGIAIKRESLGNIEVKRIRGNLGNRPIASDVPRDNSTRIHPTNSETGEIMSTQNTSRSDIQELQEKYYKVEQLEKQDLPEEVDPTKDYIQITEIASIDELKKDMVEELIEVKGYKQEEAEQIINKVVDDGYMYEKAEEEVQQEMPEQTQEDDGQEKVPWPTE